MLALCQPRPAPTHERLAIRGLERMPAFLLTVVSDADLWMYVSSLGALTCGRGRAERCLFPYETDDRLHRGTGLVGPYTALTVLEAGAEAKRWVPFAAALAPGATRNLYKTVLGHQVVFEEVHEELGLTFRYRWANARKLGFIRTAELERHTNRAEAKVDLQDGLLGIMPSGVELSTWQRASALVDAYRHAALDPLSGRLAMYRLTALIVDRAEPAESLTCNAVWSVGLPDARVTLERGGSEGPVEGRRADYLLSTTLNLEPGAKERWDIVADVALSQTEVVHRRRWPLERDARARIDAEVAEDGAALLARLAAADGVQRSGVPTDDAHHLANVLFNCMRGGVFVNEHRAPESDVQSFLQRRNRDTFARNQDFRDQLPDSVDCRALVQAARAVGDADLVRLCLEYLPLTFSRRHGDPSRPWNAFDIRVHQRDGSPRIHFQGNWRDIFQNWEALLMSYPAFLPQVVAKFVNASTADGFNPYRITSEGIDWEVPDPEDPWANIGYWGDHQIVYLARLLELFEAVDPEGLRGTLTESIYSYADVPYRLRPYAALIANPRDTIDFDEAAEQAVLHRVERVGADGRLLVDERGRVVHATLAEKLLVPVLAKLCNFVFDGGIWMNTQRPEWNDANNALAGYGLSMVTLYQLRRHMRFLATLFGSVADQEVSLKGAVAAWADAVHARFVERRALLSGAISDEARRAALDALGGEYEVYRARAYRGDLGAPTVRRLGDLAKMLEAVLPFLDRAVRTNRRADGLYHAYNLLHVAPLGDTAQVSNLYEMLEGQVNVLASGVLEPEEAIALVDALYASRMYRADQDSFMLYPDRPLPGFLDKNVIPDATIAKTPLLKARPSVEGRPLVTLDDEGRYRFGAHLRNAGDLERALDALAEDPTYADQAKAQREESLAAWEAVFHHHAFTGRSGTMYGYEGLGCIYWHMVSKLLLAVQENLHWARERGASQEILEALGAQYQRVRLGLGSAKPAEVYGAFPTDPYSHSGRAAGARQPGMTGQVKEEILTRFGELGVRFDRGTIHFGPGLLRPRDFCATEAGPPTLQFTLASTPVHYRLTDQTALRVFNADGTAHILAEGRLGPAESAEVFARSGRITRIEVDWRIADLVSNPLARDLDIVDNP